MRTLKPLEIICDYIDHIMWNLFVNVSELQALELDLFFLCVRKTCYLVAYKSLTYFVIKTQRNVSFFGTTITFNDTVILAIQTNNWLSKVGCLLKSMKISHHPKNGLTIFQWFFFRKREKENLQTVFVKESTRILWAFSCN